MNERKILLFILSVIVYCMYSVHMWFMKQNVEANAAKVPETPKEMSLEVLANSNPDKVKTNVKTKVIPLYFKDACSVLQVFSERPPLVKGKHKKTGEMDTNNNSLTMFGIAVFLVILTVNAVLDVIKVKEEERVKRQLNPSGERRQSLAEFANKKTLRRESSKFGQQLFQIAESLVNKDDEQTPPRRQIKPYTRGDSTNSYLSETTRKTHGEGSAPASISETACEPRLVKRQSVAKLIGGRPAPMVRRSSFPALPQNPEVQALMLGHRQQSFDSDDEDGRGRRVRIIRRY